jgi:hypothetical protein
VNGVWFALAVYRGELAKEKRRGAGPLQAVMGTSTTMGGSSSGTPSGAVIALAALAAAAIAVVVVAVSKAIVAVGQRLEEKLSNLKTTSESAGRVMNPVELDSSVAMDQATLDRLVKAGVIVAGAVMAIIIQGLKDELDGIFGIINAIGAAGQRACAQEIAAAVALANALAELIKELEQAVLDGKNTGALARRALDLLLKIEDAMSSLEACLKGAGGGMPPDPRNKPN